MYRDSEIGVVFHHGVLTRSAVPLRLIQLLNVVFTLVYALLTTRFLLDYVSAPPVPFVEWIAVCTNPIYLPLRAVFPNGHDPAGHPLAWSLLLLGVACALLQGVLVKLLQRAAPPRPAED